jgi:hypothetical protein
MRKEIFIALTLRFVFNFQFSPFSDTFDTTNENAKIQYSRHRDQHWLIYECLHLLVTMKI